MSVSPIRDEKGLIANLIKLLDREDISVCEIAYVLQNLTQNGSVFFRKHMPVLVHGKSAANCREILERHEELLPKLTQLLDRGDHDGVTGLLINIACFNGAPSYF